MEKITDAVKEINPNDISSSVNDYAKGKYGAQDYDAGAYWEYGLQAIKLNPYAYSAYKAGEAANNLISGYFDSKTKADLKVGPSKQAGNKLDNGFNTWNSKTKQWEK